MKKIQMIAVGLLLGGVLLSCSKETLQDEESFTGETVRCDLRFTVVGMQDGLVPATRAAVDQSPGIDITYGAAAPDTRATTNLTAEESKIKSLYLIQFAGTTDTAPVANKSGNLISSYSESAGGGIISNVTLTNTGQPNLVYLVANVDVSSFTGTLGDFKKKRFAMPAGYALDTKLPATGLPMVAYTTALPGTGFSTVFKLVPLLARVTVNIRRPDVLTGNITLRHYGASTYSLGAAEDELDVIRVGGSVADIAFGYKSVNLNRVNGNVTCTFYVPANLSGCNLDLKDPMTRCPLTAPEGATYLDMLSDGLNYAVPMGDGTLTDFNVQAGHSYTYSVVIKKSDLNDFRCSFGGYAELDTYGGARETANCYLVTNGYDRVCSFDCTVQGNGDAGAVVSSRLTPKSIHPTYGEVLWETADAPGEMVRPRIVIVGKRMLFRMGRKQGNAMIGAFDSGGTVLWSWHIWHMEEEPWIYGRNVDLTASGLGVDVKKINIMGFNLGATMTQSGVAKYSGLFYTWGRKDPFPGPDAVGSKQLTKVVGNHVPKAADYDMSGFSILAQVETAIKSPWSYFPYYYIITNYDEGDMFWGGDVKRFAGYDKTFTYKSYFDPCPPGYCVPPAYWLADNSGTNTWNAVEKGLTLSSGIFLPCSGYSGFIDYDNLPDDLYNTEIKTDHGVYYASIGTSNSEQYGLGGASVITSEKVDIIRRDEYIQDAIGYQNYNKGSVRCVRPISDRIE